MNTHPTYTEETLVAALKERGQSAFSYLYDHYSGALHTIILQILSEEELANDVLQEVFVNIWKKIETYDPAKGRLFTWMLNIARNASIDTLRSKRYQNSQKNQPLAENVNNMASSGRSNDRVDGIGLKNLLTRLKPEQRELIELAYFKGYTQEEIAALRQIPLGTVKTRIRNALIQLRTYF